MKSLPLFVFLAALCAGCGGKQTAAKTVADIRAEARGAVVVAEHAYVLVADACVAAAQAANDPKVATTCAVAMDPAYDLILGASKAVDTDWSPKAACDLAQGVALVAVAVKSLGANDSTLAPIIADAAVLAQAMLGASVCSAPAADAGT